MGQLDPRQLFVDKFAAYNIVRYSAEPNKVAAFTNLTIADLNFGVNTKTVENGIYKRTYSYVNSPSRKFTSEPQHFNAPNIASSVITTSDQMASIADIRAAQPGVYNYLDPLNNNLRTLCIVYPYDLSSSDAAAFKDQIYATLNAACKYALDRSDLDIQDWSQTVPGDMMTYVNNEIIGGWVLTIKGTQETWVIPETDYGNLIQDEETPEPIDGQTGT